MRHAVRASKTFQRLAASETLNGCSLAAFSRRLIEADIRCAPVEYASILWPAVFLRLRPEHQRRSEEHTSELQSLMRISYAVFCLKKKNKQQRAYCKRKQT